VDFLCTRALAVFAWGRMPGFCVTLPRMLCLAASVGNVSVLEELVFTRKHEISAVAGYAAAAAGQLDALRWLRARGCMWDGRTCESAAGKGQLEVPRYAHEQGCAWDKRTCSVAAGAGVRLLYEQRDPVEGGHLEVLLEVLRYAHKHGCA